MKFEETLNFETAVIRYSHEKNSMLYESLEIPDDLSSIDLAYFDNVHLLSDEAKELFNRLGIDTCKLYDYSPGHLQEFDIGDKRSLYVVTYHFFGEFVSGGIKKAAIVKYGIDFADTFYDSNAFPEKIQFVYKFPNIYFPGPTEKPQMELIIEVPMPVAY